MKLALSIVVPTMNRSRLIMDAINSVFSQDVGVPVEVVIADDGSTDETPSVCQNLQSAYGANRVVISRTEQNIGAQAARNRGFQAAMGELVLFLDSDDVVIPGGVAELASCLRTESSLEYAYGKVIQTDAQLKPLTGTLPVGAPFSDSPVEVAGYHWPIMGAMYRKSYLEKVGPWNEGLAGSQDWEYQARVKLAGGRGHFVDSVVAYWRHHSGIRVGAKAFRPDYVRSVMIACDSIIQHARKAGRCDVALERRLARKLIVHSLEWGANGHASERWQCLNQAARMLSNDVFYAALIKCIQNSPTFLDNWVWKVLTENN